MPNVSGCRSARNYPTCETESVEAAAVLPRAPSGQRQRVANCQRIGTGYIFGRMIPSFFIRNCRVDRFMPRRIAAPRAPATTQLVSVSVATM